MANPSSDSKPKYRQYHPYQHLNTTTNNNNQFTKLYNLPTSPEHLFEEQARRTRRTWSENLTFYTGISYISAATMGAAKGSVNGINAAEYGDSAKIRVSRVLSSGGLTARRFGNAAGVVGLMFGSLDALIAHHRGKDDMMGSVLAGLGTGVLYRVASGVRSAAIGGVLGGVVVGAVLAGKHVVKRYVHI